MNNIFYLNIEEATLKNEYYRNVLYTSKNQQIVLMSLNSNEDIPEETHENHDQFFRIEKGNGMAKIGDQEYKLIDGVSIIVPAGMKHYIKNTGLSPLKLYTIYSPPEHKENTIHKRQPKIFIRHPINYS